MNDAGGLKPIEGPVIRHKREVRAGCCRVAFHQVLSAREPFEHRRSLNTLCNVVAGFCPRVDRVGDISKRVPQGCDFPVEHRRQRAIAQEQAVVWAKVTMNNSAFALFWNFCEEQFMKTVRSGVVVVSITN